MKEEILYLDDNLEHLLLVEELLSDKYTVYCTHKAEIAFDILEREKIGAIISDFNMPELSGIEFFSKIEQTHPFISRILLTAYSSTDLAVSAFKEANVFEYLTKPIVYDKLVETLDKAIKATLAQKKKEKKRKKGVRLTEMLSTIFENAPNTLLLANKKGFISKINKKGFELFGNQAHVNDVLGSSIQCVNSKKGLGCGTNPEAKNCDLRNCLEQTYDLNQEISNKEGRMTLIKDGCISNYDFLFSSSLIKIKKEDHVLISLVDITENKQIAEALAKTENRYQKLFENLTSAFALHEIIIDDNGIPIDYRFLEVNHAFEKFTGIKKENVINKKVSEVMPDLEPKWIEIYGKVALTSIPINLEQFSSKFGKYYEIAAYSPEPKLFATVFTEITERKIIEQTLNFTSKRSEIEHQDAFFNEATSFLSKTLGMEHVFISKKTNNSDKATTIATLIDFSISPNVEFYIPGSPCEMIFENKQAIYQSNLIDIFPNCKFLNEINAESYAGYAIINSLGETIGHIAVLSKKPIQNPEMVLKVLSLVAVRITGELELNSYLSEKHMILTKLENTILERDEEIELRKDADKKLLAAVISTEENERSSFAREMHDGIGPQLSIINMYLNVLLNSNKTKENTDILEKAISILEEALHSVVEISHAMSPSVVKKNGLAYAIESFCKKIAYDNTPKFILNVPLKQRLSYEIEFSLYRVCTELINNSLKYANASSITINLFENKNNICLTYTDDGVGFDVKNAKSKTSGMGLENINNRINALKGSVKIQSNLNQGVHFEILVPNVKSKLQLQPTVI